MKKMSHRKREEGKIREERSAAHGKHMNSASMGIHMDGGGKGRGVGLEREGEKGCEEKTG